MGDFGGCGIGDRMSSRAYRYASETRPTATFKSLIAHTIQLSFREILYIRIQWLESDGERVELSTSGNNFLNMLRMARGKKAKLQQCELLFYALIHCFRANDHQRSVTITLISFYFN